MDYKDWREPALFNVWLWKLNEAKVVNNKSNHNVHLVLGWAFVPLLKQSGITFGRQKMFGEHLGISPLL